MQFPAMMQLNSSLELTQLILLYTPRSATSEGVKTLLMLFGVELCEVAHPIEGIVKRGVITTQDKVSWMLWNMHIAFDVNEEHRKS